MADLIAALDQVLQEQKGQPSEAVERLTKAAARLAANWAAYQEALDPEGWQRTKARLAALDASRQDQTQPKASNF